MAISGTISASSARSRVKNFRRARTAVLAEESTQSWKSVDCFPAPVTRPLLSSAASVVNPTDHGSMNTDQKTIGISERLFIDRYPLVIERSADAHGNTRLVSDVTGKVVDDMNYDAFGDALGFNAATALTTYLYSSMPFDAASGNYYDHARFYNAATGSFTQSDYGYSGSLANPMADLPYAFTGNDPINLSDLNGHGFSIPDVLANISIMTAMAGIAPVAAAGLYSLKAGLPDALGFGGFFEANLANLPGGVGI